MAGPTHSLKGSISVSVYYEDTDALGFVYHANYLKFFERGREQLFGLALLKSLNDTGTLFVVSGVQMRLRAPARHADVLEIASRLEYSRSPRMHCEHSAKCDGRLLVEATIELAVIDSAGKPQRLKDEIIQAMTQIASF